MIANRNALQKAATERNYPDLLVEYKIKVEEVKKAVKEDKKRGESAKLCDQVSSKTAWRMAKSITGVEKCLVPQKLLKPNSNNLSRSPKSVRFSTTVIFRSKHDILIMPVKQTTR